MDRRLIKLYRTAEDYHRYLPAHAERHDELALLYRGYRRHFGRRVLDLGCGGGVLGEVLERSGRTYVGMDANPDMIREARKAAHDQRSARSFVSGDIIRTPLRGRFDTLTLLGNVLGHLSVHEMDRLLVRRASNVHRGTTFLIDYRDVVEMFWRGAWDRVHVETKKRGTVVCRTRSVDLRSGKVQIRARPASGAWSVDYTHAVWSPFILEALLRARGWRLLKRSPWRSPLDGRVEPFRWMEVYRFVGS